MNGKGNTCICIGLKVEEKKERAKEEEGELIKASHNCPFNHDMTFQC